MSDIVERLRATPNWQRQDFKTWKDGCSVYDRAPFEAADEIERLRSEVAEYKEGFKESMTDHAATLEQLAEAERVLRDISNREFDNEEECAWHSSNYFKGKESSAGEKA